MSTDVTRDRKGRDDLHSKLKHYRLNQDEYELMKKYLGHEPVAIEWALYSALWSEHCSYKSSKVHLRKLFTKHPRVVQGPGENAGVIDLGEGERVAFKMESHNHPSFIEPTQGAATGVGGILRDIFTMGARPIASMNYLCFGAADDALTPRLLKGVVGGIGGYGNCVGVPTVNGQTTFHSSYNNNILVNAFSLGLFRPYEKVFYGKAEGVGNLVVYAGARTGRDGVHGAAMASESFDSDLEKKKPNVQIGDPFLEKLLIEACLEVMSQGLVVGIQDMGAAGLTSSTFEMAARAKSGLKINLKKVPLREPDIGPEEILLSESQERMILVVKPENFGKIEKIFHRWDLQCAVIGEITGGENVELFWGDELLARVAHEPLVEKAPVYERPFELPEPRLQNRQATEGSRISNPEDWNETFLKFVAQPEMGSRAWITRQYDQRVGSKTIAACGDGVALLRLPDSKRALGMAVGCRPLLMAWDVAAGSRDAVVMPTLQLAARGVKALACTDCLNFGNPEKKKIMGQLVASLRSLDEACRALDVPIISGNVSLYNETRGENIVPTPSTGIVGVGAEKIENEYRGPDGILKKADLDLWLVATQKENTWFGEYAVLMEETSVQGTTASDLEEIKSLQHAFLDLAKFGKQSAVIGRGGLAVTLTGLSRGGVGVEVQIEEKDRSRVETYFAERFYSAVWAIERTDEKEVERISKKFPSVRITKIGRSFGRAVKINHDLNVAIEALNTASQSGLENIVAELD